jgi:cohesin loading factor subunit SCC2
VSIRSIDSVTQPQETLVLSTEETITKASNEIISRMNVYNTLFEKYTSVSEELLQERADIRQMLKDTKSFSSHILRLYSCQEAFNRLDRDLVFGTVGNLDRLIRHGSNSLLYANQTQDSNDFMRVMAALEAMVLMERLIIRVSKVLVIPEESLGTCVETTRFHLHNNVLPFYDARIRAAVRPNIENPAGESEEEKTGKAKKTKRKCIPSFLEQVEDRVLASLELLADIIPMFKIETAVFSPFIRTMIQSMTSSSSSELQFKTVNVLSSVYYSCSDLRFTIFNDVFTVVTPFLGIGKKIRKDILLASEAGSMKPVNVLSALLVQTVQTCADLPTKSSPEDIRASYAICISAADQFWSFCMERIGAAKSLRLETDADFLCVMLGIVQDVLELSSSKHWPCASTILIRLVSLLNTTSGLQSQDALVRQICVDILGKMLTFVHKDSLLLSESSQRLDDISHDHGYDTISEGSVDLVLRSLASSEAPSSRSSMRFLCLRTLCEHLAKAESAVDNEDDLREQTSKLLISARDSLKRHESLHSEAPVSDEDVSLIMKVTVHEQFISAAPAMLSWLIEILDSKHQMPTTRSKAVRALGDVVTVDKRLLEVPSMLTAIEHALQDDSISVREAALVIVGKHMIKDASLAIRLLHVVIRATEDAGSSVRKSAIKILRDCALVIPHEHQERSNDAYRAILNRSTDSEETVKAFVVKIFRSLWFDPVAEGEGGLKVERSPTDRAKSLANLANSVIETLPGNTSGIRNLMDRSNPLVVLLSEIKDEDRDDQSRTRLNGEDTKTSVALLEQFMYGSENTLSYLRAIYAMVLSNPRCCIPESDPLKFIRALAPHLKVVPGESQTPDDIRKGAEETLYSLGIVTSLLDEIVEERMLSMDVATEISEDLPEIINKHKFTTVVSAACGCLAACAMSSPTASGRFLNITAQYVTLLENPQQHMKILPRFIFIVGQLYRFGTKLLQQVDVFLPDQPDLASKMTPEACMRLLNSFWATSMGGSPALAAQIQRNSLEAICQVMIASPLLALRGASDAQKSITQGTLQKKCCVENPYF